MGSMARDRRVAGLDFGTTFSIFLTYWLGYRFVADLAYSRGYIVVREERLTD